jgi:hypothetical protein
VYFSTREEVFMLTRKEGTITRSIERRTARIPSGLFLTAAAASIVGSLAAFIRGKKQLATLVGEWVPTFLLLGMYNKFVKEAT